MQNTPISDSLTNKLRKLLALANNNANQNEAESALLKAQSLALENNINLATIKINDGIARPNHPILKGVPIQHGKREPTCQKYVNWLLQRYFNVKIINSGDREYGKSMTFIGKQADLELAHYLNEFLNSKMPQLWHNYYHNTPGITLEHKQSYLYGIYQGMCSKLDEQKAKIEETSLNTQESKNNYALMVINNREALEKAVHQFYPHLSAAPKRQVNLNHGSSMAVGAQHGRQINFNRPLAQSSVSGARLSLGNG